MHNNGLNWIIKIFKSLKVNEAKSVIFRQDAKRHTQFFNVES